VCTADRLPALKWFSATDVSSQVEGITCVRVDRHVAGVDYRTFAGWLKLAARLGQWPW